MNDTKTRPCVDDKNCRVFGVLLDNPKWLAILQIHAAPNEFTEQAHSEGREFYSVSISDWEGVVEFYRDPNDGTIDGAFLAFGVTSDRFPPPAKVIIDLDQIDTMYYPGLDEEFEECP